MWSDTPDKGSRKLGSALNYPNLFAASVVKSGYNPGFVTQNPPFKSEWMRKTMGQMVTAIWQEFSTCLTI